MEAGARFSSRSVGMAKMREIIFVIRCSGAATAAYELAESLGLPEASWAAISAVIVSQKQLKETRSSLAGRIAGTLIGIVVTILISQLASYVAAPTGIQIAGAVAIAALVARQFPQLRVAMWTCPTLLLAAQPHMPIFAIALRRGSGVILGAMVGWVFHWAAEILVIRMSKKRATARMSAGVSVKMPELQTATSDAATSPSPGNQK